VVKPGAVALEKARHRALGARREEQLDVTLSDPEQHRLDTELLDVLAVLERHPEPVSVELDGALEIGDGHADVVDATEHGRGV
jgi:hypothetical protein